MSQGTAILSPLPLPDGSIPPQRLQVIDVPGVGFAAGALYGEACRALIGEHLEYALGRLERGRGVGVAEALRRAAGRIEAFHRRQVRQSWFSTDECGTLGQIVRPLAAAGGC